MKIGRFAHTLVTVLLLAGCVTGRQPEKIDLVTPLPANFSVQLPPAEMPQRIVQFIGIWKGDWLLSQPGSAPSGILHHTLVVKKAEASSSGGYRVSVIYSVGVPPATWENGGPGFWEFSGTIGTDGMLRLTAPGPDGGQVAYTVSDDGQSLNGRYVLPGKSISGIFLRIR